MPNLFTTEAAYTDKQRAEIQQQLDRLLGNTHFSHSKRFPSFLRFIVQEELEGRGDQLKERTLGIEVFGRDPDYDTTSDPIVRVTAAEIRKRIAQYYQDASDPSELRISLPAGSYMPHFDWPGLSPRTSHVDLPVFELPETLAGSGLHAAAEHPHRPSRVSWFTFGAILILLTGGVFFWMQTRPTTLDRFWAPVLVTDEPAVVCFPQSEIDGIVLRNAADPTQQHHLEEKMSGVIIDDLQPLVTVSGLLEMRHQHYILTGEDTATLTDLRQGPAIFVGAFDNAWTLRMTRGLRYRFGNDPQMTHFWIEDTQSPTHQQWSIDRSVQETTNNYRDYAIVARFRDATTGKLAVVAAGIARGGTVAAGEFLTRPDDMDAILSRAPRNWDRMNMEFVLSTEIIDGRSAAPKVEAVYFW